MADENNFHIDCPHWSNLTCQDYSEKARAIDILWFRSKQPQLQTPNHVKLEELDRDIVQELEHKNKETPRAKQRKQVLKTKVNPNKKLDFKSDDDDEILEILKRHNKKVESIMGSKKAGKENCLAASNATVNPSITAKKVAPDSINVISNCPSQKSFENADSCKPINKRISMHGVRRVITPRSRIISPSSNPSPEDRAPKMTMPRKRVSIAVSRPHPDFIKRLGSKDVKLDIKLEDNNRNSLLDMKTGDIVGKQVSGVSQDISKKRVPCIKEVKPLLKAKELGPKCIVKAKEPAPTFKATFTKTKAPPVVRPCVRSTATKATTINSKRQTSSVSLNTKTSRDTTVNHNASIPPSKPLIKSSSNSVKSVSNPSLKHTSRASVLTAAKVARRPSTAPTAKAAVSKPTKMTSKTISTSIKIDDEVLKYLDPGFTMKPIRPVSSASSLENVPSTSSQTYPNAQNSVANQKQSRLSYEKEPKNFLFKTHHSRYSVDTPSPPQNDTSRKIDSDSDSDFDEFIYQKIKAHNKRIEEQSIKANRIPASSQRCEPTVKQPRKVSLHLGSPSKPKMRVHR